MGSSISGAVVSHAFRKVDRVSSAIARLTGAIPDVGSGRGRLANRQYQFLLTVKEHIRSKCIQLYISGLIIRLAQYLCDNP